MLVGVWEEHEGIGAAAEAGIRRAGGRLVTGRHPAELVELGLDLLAVSPGARGWASHGRLRAKASRLWV